MDKNIAAATYSKFYNDKFMPAIEEALADGRLDGDLAEDLKEAIRISRTTGPSASFGNSMLGEVLFTILCESLPKPKKTRSKS